MIRKNGVDISRKVPHIFRNCEAAFALPSALNVNVIKPAYEAAGMRLEASRLKAFLGFSMYLAYTLSTREFFWTGPLHAPGD